MERTKYTPKRLLSLLLALIMLLGMFPTAALAAEPAGGIVLNSDDYKAHGLIFKFEPILPEGPYFENSTDKAVTIHYTISTATGEDYVKITERKSQHIFAKKIKKFQTQAAKAVEKTASADRKPRISRG